MPWAICPPFGHDHGDLEGSGMPMRGLGRCVCNMSRVPVTTGRGAVAQLVAHHTGSVGVRGSSPLSSTRKSGDREPPSGGFRALGVPFAFAARSVSRSCTVTLCTRVARGPNATIDRCMNRSIGEGDLAAAADGALQDVRSACGRPDRFRAPPWLLRVRDGGCAACAGADGCAFAISAVSPLWSGQGARPA